MVHLGLMYLAGQEITNAERIAAYVANGISPAAATVTPRVCSGLAEAATGGPWSPYTTPQNDAAPWYDAQDGDTGEFGGLILLGLTGADDTTRTAEVIPTLTGGGVPGAVRYGPRTMVASGLLIGSSSEGVYAGLSWLSRALHGGCDETEGCGPSADLRVFTVCPGPISDTEDPDALVAVGLTHPNDPGTIPGGWLVSGADFEDEDAPGTILAPLGGTAMLRGFTRNCSRYAVSVTWRLRSVSGFVSVTAGYVDLNGVVTEAASTAVPDTDVNLGITFELGIPDDNWRPVLITDDAVVVTSVIVEQAATVSAADCLRPYERRLPLTVTQDGPTVLETITAGCVHMLRVEWTWVSAPYRYSPPVTLINGIGWGQVPVEVADGVTYDEGGGTVVDATPWNCSGPTADPEACSIDPLAPTFGIPPAVPVIVDTTRPGITTEDVRDVSIVIGPEQVPANEGALTIRLTADGDPVVAARIRIWDDADGAGAVPDNCDFLGEYLIDYIPTGGTMTIDGASGEITTYCAGATGPEDSSSMVRGAFGGPAVPTILRCDRRYLVRVQWLDTYPRTSTAYTLGDPNGALTIVMTRSDRD